MRLKENFFDSDEMKILQGMEDGYQYCVILLKLYLKSLQDDGRLMYHNIIPYSARMIAQVTGHQEAVVEKALNIFEKMGFIDVLDSGAIYMLGIQGFIGKTSTEADRVKAYRERIDIEKGVKQICTNVHQEAYKCTPENRDIEIRDKSIENRDLENKESKEKRINNIEKRINNIIDASGISDEVKSAFNDFVENRKALKAPMTTKAVELALKNLNKLSQDADEQVAIINQSIERGWKGLFALQNKMPLRSTTSAPRKIGFRRYADAAGEFTVVYSKKDDGFHVTKVYDDGHTEVVRYDSEADCDWIS